MRRSYGHALPVPHAPTSTAQVVLRRVAFVLSRGSAESSGARHVQGVLDDRRAQPAMHSAVEAVLRLRHGQPPPQAETCGR